MMHEEPSYIEIQRTNTGLCFVSSEVLPVATEQIIHFLPFTVTFAPHM
jgi:hypothetical protein